MARTQCPDCEWNGYYDAACDCAACARSSEEHLRIHKEAKRQRGKASKEAE